MAASSSSAADPNLHKYDVFISFRGETRNGFTSHLYSALCEKQIKAYIDEVSLEKGDDISRALPNAIKESAISIIIFSENYASSRWCLDELVHILKRREEKDQIVLPIFYGIDPSHIRKQEGSYAAAFVEHEERYKDKMKKVQEWREALTEASGLSGWDLRNKSESEIVKEVVERVRTKMDTIWSRSINSDNLVGIQRRLEKIESLLRDWDIVGICGMGGIGKTTLASAIFKRIYNQFEGSYFAANVREESNKKGLADLANQVFSKLLNEKDIDLSKSEVNVRLRRKMLLLVLDDVDTFSQLQDLVGDRNWLGPGSKIIVTSRDLQVLKHIVDETYEAEELNSDEAQELFYLNAFKGKTLRREFTNMSRSVVRKAKGNPLALVVLSSSLYSLSIKDWKSALEKINGIGNREIQKVLRISYDGLDAEEQDIFLDIACFFKDEERAFVERILEHKSIYGITVLVNKSLITIEDGKIRMHDLIQEMGRDIVCHSAKKLGERSRLWTNQDVSYVLNNNKGTEAIEGIYLPHIEEDLHLRPDVFEDMCKLRLLRIYPFNCKVYINGALKYLPNSLRYLFWVDYPGKSLPSNFNAQNLVELDMPNSMLEQLWDGVQKLGSLRRIKLVCSELLTKIPDLSLAPKLELINLTGCYNLKSLPKLPRNIEQLLLDFSGIEQIPSSSIESLCNLRILYLCFCKSLASLPANINLKALEKLNLQGTSIQELPSTLCKFTRLKTLILSGCSKLKKFPMLSGLCSLTELNLDYCNIREIPDWLGSLTSLVTLSLRRNIFDGIPSSIGNLYKLNSLDISYCRNLRSLPELPLSIKYLNAAGCLSLEMVSTSRSTLTLGRWLDKYDTDIDRRQFLFANCSKLGENAISNIFKEFLYKVFCIATAPREVITSKGFKPQVAVCYPRHEILKWFNNQYEGSSTTIRLPPNWYNPKTFLGFVVSFVVAEKISELKCALHLRTNNYRFTVDMFSIKVASCLDHIVMGYFYFDHSEANFEKYPVTLELQTCGGVVKRWGVRMLYLKDALEESDDGTTANFESWTTDAIDDGTTNDEYRSSGRNKRKLL